MTINGKPPRRCPYCGHGIAAHSYTCLDCRDLPALDPAPPRKP